MVLQRVADVVGPVADVVSGQVDEESAAAGDLGAACDVGEPAAPGRRRRPGGGGAAPAGLPEQPASFRHDGDRPPRAEDLDDLFRPGVLTIVRATLQPELARLRQTLGSLGG
ncbi:hypothetical protein [Streptomyces poriticola]|uniref:hypothetical protein n=1 Tax=Streptomyces poriticola TaxID=3120506 RepID=UPI0038CD3336